MIRRTLFAAVALACLAAVGQGAEPIRSGTPVGEKLPKPFFPLNLNGESAGEEDCPVCRFGKRPSALVFTRQTGPAVLELARGLEKAAAEKQADEFRACVVILTAEKGEAKRLAQLAREEGLQRVLVAIHAPEGPDEYGVAVDADVTVLLVADRVVQSNRAYRKGEFSADAAKAIVVDYAKLKKAP